MELSLANAKVTFHGRINKMIKASLFSEPCRFTIIYLGTFKTIQLLLCAFIPLGFSERNLRFLFQLKHFFFAFGVILNGRCIFLVLLLIFYIKHFGSFMHVLQRSESTCIRNVSLNCNLLKKCGPSCAFVAGSLLKQDESLHENLN